MYTKSTAFKTIYQPLLRTSKYTFDFPYQTCCQSASFWVGVRKNKFGSFCINFKLTKSTEMLSCVGMCVVSVGDKLFVLICFIP